MIETLQILSFLDLMFKAKYYYLWTNLVLKWKSRIIQCFDFLIFSSRGLLEAAWFCSLPTPNYLWKPTSPLHRFLWCSFYFYLDSICLKDFLARFHLHLIHLKFHFVDLAMGHEIALEHFSLNFYLARLILSLIYYVLGYWETLSKLFCYWFLVEVFDYDLGHFLSEDHLVTMKLARC